MMCCIVVFSKSNAVEDALIGHGIKSSKLLTFSKPWASSSFDPSKGLMGC